MLRAAMSLTLVLSGVACGGDTEQARTATAAESVCDELGMCDTAPGPPTGCVVKCKRDGCKTECERDGCRSRCEGGACSIRCGHDDDCDDDDHDWRACEPGECPDLCPAIGC